MGFVRGDLIDRVGGGVDDRLAGPDVLFSQRVENFGARGVAIAQDAGHAGRCDEVLGQL